MLFFIAKQMEGKADHANWGCDKERRRKLCNGLGDCEMGGKSEIGLPE